MCGRYSSTKAPKDLADEFRAVDATDGAKVADFNVAPTKQVVAVVERHPRDADGAPDPDRTERTLRLLRWGLVPSWAKDRSVGSRMINSRAESLLEKPAFRRAVLRRRCLVPADGWYEWAKKLDGPGKQPYYMTSRDGSVLAFAGLWEVWGEGDDRLYTCTVITEPAVGALAEIHDRMPLVLPRDRWADWLDPAREDVAELAAPTPPELVEGLELRPVSPAVNSAKNNGVELTAGVESVAAPADQPALF